MTTIYAWAGPADAASGLHEVRERLENGDTLTTVAERVLRRALLDADAIRRLLAERERRAA